MNHYSLKRSVTLIAFLRNFLFPTSCAVCGESLLDAQESYTMLCRDCSDSLKIDWHPRCPRCGKPLISELSLCSECRTHEKSPFESSFSLFPYGGKAKQLILSYKFGSFRANSHFLCDKLLECIVAFETEWGFPLAVVPVPPRPGKIKKKGWDQVALLAWELKYRGIPVQSCLRRLASRSQKELNRVDRERNLKGKFICTKVPPESVILIDDVITTGATLNECAVVLKKAGCKRVYALAICYD